MKYIGIRGHRGAGKNSISYLLGRTIDYLITYDNNLTDSSYDDLYKSWVDDVMNEENTIYTSSLKYVYFESFADTLKLFVELITGIPHDYIYNDFYKDHTIINIKDFSYKVYDKIPNDINILSRDEVYKLTSKNENPIAITKDIYMSLREFILYFGVDIMQRHLGLNVWVKALKRNENMLNPFFNEGDYYKIFSDVKTPSEVTYILEKNGCIIHITRPNNRKKSQGFDKLSKDGRIDYTIYVGGSLYELKNQILEIAKQIIKRNNND